MSDDLISRQEAIDTCLRMEAVTGYDAGCLIAQLPSAQPEPLTDNEQRIFLAAMIREKKVCRQVDDEYRDCREPYEDSLVSICQEIIRKVKDALWTI